MIYGITIRVQPSMDMPSLSYLLHIKNNHWLVQWKVSSLWHRTILQVNISWSNGGAFRVTVQDAWYLVACYYSEYRSGEQASRVNKGPLRLDGMWPVFDHKYCTYRKVVVSSVSSDEGW